jgi:hypothetical protein
VVARIVMVRLTGTYRLVRLLPDSDRFVVRAGHDKVRLVTDCEGPDLARVARELLDAFEL